MVFDVQVRRGGEWTVVCVVGDLDLASSPRLRSTLAGVTAVEAPRIVLDLAAVDFLDSSGLGVVLGALRRVRQAGGELRIVVSAPHVRRVFEITGLDRVLELFGDVGAAEAAPRAQAPLDVEAGT